MKLKLFSFFVIAAHAYNTHLIREELIITKALYGDNCPSTNNVTTLVSNFCLTSYNATTADCTFTVCACGQTNPACVNNSSPCVTDPSPGCSKDFTATWRCTGDTSDRSLHVPPEAGFGSAVSFYCGTPPPPPEPWQMLHGGNFSGPKQHMSPDPLVSYKWIDGAYDPLKLQIFKLPASAASVATGTNSSSFLNVSSAVGSFETNITVSGPGTIVFDFGVEAAAWIEIDTEGLDQTDLQLILMSTGEGNMPTFVGNYKTGTPVVYGSTLRLETNEELYEGVRYAFFSLSSAPSKPFIISAVRLMCQVRPVNYTGSFHSAGDNLLERIWWTGAYTIRVLLLPTYMGSVLVERGDRISWTGDAFVSQGTFYSFASDYSIPLQNLNDTSCEDCCEGIATYCVLFVLSSCEYLAATGDSNSFLYFVPMITSKLERAFQLYKDPEGLRFVGWDDRTGSGFANNTTPETQMMYRFISIRAWAAFAKAIAPFNSSMSDHYQQYATDAMTAFRTQPIQPWYKDFGLHAAADAINTGFTTVEEQAGMAAAVLSDIVQLPSLSHFNQFFIVNSFAMMGAFDRGVELIRLCWGSDIALGATTFFEVGHPGLADILPSGPSPLPAEQNGWTLMAADWSTGATQWLSRNILGLRPLENGWEKALIAPHIAHTMKSVCGSIGTPHGILSINATRAVGERQVSVIEITIPHGVNAVVRFSAVLLQRLGLDIIQRSSQSNELSAVTIEYVDGRKLKDIRAISNHEEAPLIDESNALAGRTSVLEFNLSHGHHILRAFHSATVDEAAFPWSQLGSPFPPPSWPGRFLGSDVTTMGNWIGQYGKSGYTLFGWKNLSSDLKVLPPFVEDVILWSSDNSGFLGARVKWENSTVDERALQNPQGTGRAIGAATSYGGGTFIVDIVLTAAAVAAKTEYILSLYACDYGPTPWGSGSIGENRTSQILLLSGWPDFNPVTPRQVLKEYTNGVWMRYSVQGSIRVRLGVIRGDMSVLSALAFD